jgi:hypothetical protein
MRRFKSYAIGAAGMLVLVAAIVLATGSGSAVAASISSVFVTNTASHPVPVHETNTDANGNIKVHEQGTVVVQQTGTPVHIQLVVNNGRSSLYTVPAGKRLEIQYIKGFQNPTSGIHYVDLVTSSSDLAFIGHYSPDTGGDDIDEQVTIYLEPGEVLEMQTPLDNDNNGQLDVYGVLTNA